MKDNRVDFGCHSNEIWNQEKSLCQFLTFCKISNKSNKILLRYRTFIFFIVLQDCVCDVIFVWKWGSEPSKWRLSSCSNSWLCNEISRQPFGALRSVRAHFFAFLPLFHLRVTYFFEWSCPLKCEWYENFYCFIWKSFEKQRDWHLLLLDKFSRVITRRFQVMGIPRKGGQCLEVIYSNIVELNTGLFTRYVRRHLSQKINTKKLPEKLFRCLREPSNIS